MRHARKLVDRQRVEFRTEHHCRSRFAAFVDHRHAVPAQRRQHLVRARIGEEFDASFAVISSSSDISGC
jgi:hypothetical protein